MEGTGLEKPVQFQSQVGGHATLGYGGVGRRRGDQGSFFQLNPSRPGASAPSPQRCVWSSGYSPSHKLPKVPKKPVLGPSACWAPAWTGTCHGKAPWAPEFHYCVECGLLNRLMCEPRAKPMPVAGPHGRRVAQILQSPRVDCKPRCVRSSSHQFTP